MTTKLFAWCLRKIAENDDLEFSLSELRDCLYNAIEDVEENGLLERKFLYDCN